MRRRAASTSSDNGSATHARIGAISLGMVNSFRQNDKREHRHSLPRDRPSEKLSKMPAGVTQPFFGGAQVGANRSRHDH
jgi:hypothetical protein